MYSWSCSLATNHLCFVDVFDGGGNPTLLTGARSRNGICTFGMGR